MVRKTGNMKNPFTQISTGFKSSWTYIDNRENKILLLTNDGASRKKVVKFDVDKGTFQTLIPEQKEVLLSVVRSQNKLVCHFMKDASSHLLVYSMDGIFEREISLPTYCTVSALNGNKNDSLLFYAVSSFTFPETVFMYNLSTEKSIIPFELRFSVKLTFSANSLNVKHILQSS